MLQKYNRLVIAFATAAVALGALAANDYATLSERADRAYRHSEWASASALYDLMLEQQPAATRVYGRSIVANALLSDSTAQINLLARAIDNHIPFDSIFASVERESFSNGHPEAYERFLTNCREAYPWMSRSIDGTLLKFYTFRRTGDQMIAYAQRMLDGAPSNVSFLRSLADGYMLTADYTRGIATYLHILSLDPDNYHALLTLGNWYALHTAPASTSASTSLASPSSSLASHSASPSENRANARLYLTRAYALRPSPFVARILRAL